MARAASTVDLLVLDPSSPTDTDADVDSLSAAVSGPAVVGSADGGGKSIIAEFGFFEFISSFLLLFGGISLSAIAALCAACIKRGRGETVFFLGVRSGSILYMV